MMIIIQSAAVAEYNNHITAEELDLFFTTSVLVMT